MSKGGAGKEIANGIRLVTIDGFKGFQTEARVPLRPLTIIMGAK